MRLSAERITTERLVLEPLRVDHAAELAIALNDPVMHKFTGGAPASEAELIEQFEVRVAETSPDGTEIWLNWVIRFGSEAIGFVQATVTHEGDAKDADIAWVVGVPWQGRGLAKEASAAMMAWLRDKGVTGARAHIHPQHEASAAVARSVGLERTTLDVAGETVWERSFSE